MFETPKQIQSKISLGVFLVWSGIVATASSSMLYWGMTLMIFNVAYMDGQDYLAKIALYGMFFMSFVIEAYKKSVLGTFQSKKHWYWLVFASVLTSVGGTMITNQTRQNVLTTSSNQYVTAKNDLASAKLDRGKYARCASMSIDDLDKKLLNNRTNVPRKPNGKKDWGKFRLFGFWRGQ